MYPSREPDVRAVVGNGMMSKRSGVVRVDGKGSSQRGSKRWTREAGLRNTVVC